MSWSIVKEPLKKPIGWWYHKILCELSYFIENNISATYGLKKYYYHLDKLCDYGFNLYGEKI